MIPKELLGKRVLLALALALWQQLLVRALALTLWQQLLVKVLALKLLHQLLVKVLAVLSQVWAVLVERAKVQAGQLLETLIVQVRVPARLSVMLVVAL